MDFFKVLYVLIGSQVSFNVAVSRDFLAFFFFSVNVNPPCDKQAKMVLLKDSFLRRNLRNK